MRDPVRRRNKIRYPGELVLEHLTSATGLATVFLVVELGWERVAAVSADPLPVAAALLCFVHIVVYWLNFIHLSLFADTDRFGLGQTWTISAFGLGLVMYPIVLSAWIDGDDLAPYLAANVALCLLLAIWVVITPNTGGDRSYLRYRRWAPPIAVLAYLALFVAEIAGAPVVWAVWFAPVLFVAPHGASLDDAPADIRRDEG